MTIPNFKSEGKGEVVVLQASKREHTLRRTLYKLHNATYLHRRLRTFLPSLHQTTQTSSAGVGLPLKNTKHNTREDKRKWRGDIEVRGRARSMQQTYHTDLQLLSC
jgi:hypothetical protein